MTKGLHFIILTVLSLQALAGSVYNQVKDVPSNAFIAVDITEDMAPVIQPVIDQELNNGTVMTLDDARLTLLVQAGHPYIRLSVPFNGSQLDLLLNRVHVLSQDFEARLSSGGAASYQPGVYYRGIIEGDSTSLVGISFFNDKVWGIASSNTHGNVNIVPLKQAITGFTHVVYSDLDLVNKPGFECSTAREANASMPQFPQTSGSNRGGAPCVEVYYEITYSMFQENGSNITSTLNWMTAQHNNMATLFANELINVVISDSYVWNTPDIYGGLTTSFDKLIEFEFNTPNFNANFGHLLDRHVPDGLGGVAASANFSGLCGISTVHCYSDLQSNNITAVPTYSWNTNVVAHEFGHIFGSPHTHDCSFWSGGAIDGCGPTFDIAYSEGGSCIGPIPSNGGTVMSYCHLLQGVGINLSNGFGTQPGNLMRNLVNNGWCFPTNCSAIIAGDNCGNAVTINSNINCVNTSGSLAAFTASGVASPSCANAVPLAGQDVWYKFQAVAPQHVVTVGRPQSGGNNFFPLLALYSGCNANNEIACDYGATGNLTQTFQNLTPGATYYLRLMNLDPNTQTSGVAYNICITHSAVQACFPPASFSVSGVQSTAATLNWGGAFNAVGYLVEYRVSGTSTWSSSATANPTLSLSGLACGTTYQWRVSTICGGASGQSAASAIQTFNTNACAASCPVPGTPATFAVGPDFVDIAWNTANNATYYQVEYRRSVDANWTRITPVGGTSINITNLDCGGVPYLWRVRSVCGNDNSQWTNVQPFVTQTCAVVDVCDTLIADSVTQVTYTSAVLSWGGESAATGYELVYAVSGTGNWSSINTANTSFTLNNLTCSTTYDWYVIADCADGSSVGTPIDTFSTVLCGSGVNCAVPADAEELTVNETSVDLQWQAVGTAIAYQILYKESTTNDYQTVTASSTTYTLSNLKCATSYNWQVRSVCSSSNSAWSAVRQFATDACTTTGLQELTNDMGMNVYPNPTAGSFTITVAGVANQPVNIDLIDALGRTLLQHEVMPANGNATVQVQQGALSNGVYLARVQVADRTLMKRIVIGF